MVGIGRPWGFAPLRKIKKITETPYLVEMPTFHEI